MVQESQNNCPPKQHNKPVYNVLGKRKIGESKGRPSNTTWGADTQGETKLYVEKTPIILNEGTAWPSSPTRRHSTVCAPEDTDMSMGNSLIKTVS
jgi:hypothetical protein